MATPVELLYRLIRGTNNQIGEPVLNLIGPVPRSVSGTLLSQEQRWLLLAIPGNGLLNVEEYLQQYSTVEDRQRQFLVGQNGVTAFTGQYSRLYMLRGMVTVPSSDAIPVTVATASTNDEFSIWVDGTQRLRSAQGSSITLTLSEGRHLIEILIDSNSFAVHLPQNIAVNASDDVLKAPTWSSVESGYVDPVMGTPGVKLNWYNDVRAGGWSVLRRDLESVGRILSLGVVDNAGEFVVTVGSEDDLTTTLAVGATLYSGFAPIGVIRFVSYDPDAEVVYDSLAYTGIATIRLRLLAGRLVVSDLWIGRDASSGVFREVARVQRVGTHALVSWVDTNVRFNFGYEYALQSYGLFDPSVLSPMSAVIYVRAGDDDPPGPIEFLEDYPLVSGSRVTVKYLTPEDADYAGCRVYFKNVVAVGTSLGGNTATLFQLEEPLADPASVVGGYIALTDGTGAGQTVRIVALEPSDTENRTYQVAPSLVPIPDETTEYEVSVFLEVITDYGLPDTKDQMDFVRIEDEEGLPKYGLYYFPTFDHAQNQQSFAEATLWEYDSSDDICDTPVPPDITLKQLSDTDVDTAIAEGRLPAVYKGRPVADGSTFAVLELGASDSCDGKRGVMIEYRRQEQWDGDSTGGNSETILNDTQRSDDALYETGTATGVDEVVFNNRDRRMFSLVDTSKTWVENFFRDRDGIVRITGGKNTGQESYVVANTTDTLYISPGWSVDTGAIDNTSVYEIAYHNTEDDSDDPWLPNALRNYIVEILNGPGEDEVALIVNNSATQLELAPLRAIEPYYVGRGVVHRVEAGNLAPGLPSGLKRDDIMLCALVSRDNVASTMTGVWNQVFSVDNGLDMHASLWWTRKQVNVNPSTAITHTSGGAAIAQIIGIRGCISTGSPIFDYATESNASDLFTITYPTVAGAAYNSLAVLFGFAGANGYSLNPEGSSLTLTERIDTNTNLGNDAGLIALVSEPFSGATGEAVATYSQDQRHVGATVVLVGQTAAVVEDVWHTIPDEDSTYQIAWVGALPASAPARMDDTQGGNRGRLVLLNKQADNNFITVRARDRDGNLSGELSYAADWDTFPEVVSVDIRFGFDSEGSPRVYVRGFVDDDCQSIEWWVDPQQPGTPFEALPELWSPLTTNKTFDFEFPYFEMDRRLLIIRPYPEPDAQGEPGVDWVQQVTNAPRTTLIIESKDKKGAYSAKSVRLTFKVSPLIVREEFSLRESATDGVLSTDSDGVGIRDDLANFPVTEDPLTGGYKYNSRTHNWYFVEFLDPSAAADRLCKINNNEATTLSLNFDQFVDGETQVAFPRQGDPYTIWRGVTYWRWTTITKAEPTPEWGPWKLTNNPEVIDRSGLKAIEGEQPEILVQFFSVITGLPPEPVQTSRLDPDDIAEIEEFLIDEDPAYHLHVHIISYDDDVRDWQLYAKRGSWPVKAPLNATPDPVGHPLDPDFLRLYTPIKVQQEAGMAVAEGTWYVILVPFNSFGEAGPRKFESVLIDGIVSDDPTDPTVGGLSNFAVTERWITNETEARFFNQLSWEHTQAVEDNNLIVQIRVKRSDLSDEQVLLTDPSTAPYFWITPAPGADIQRDVRADVDLTDDDMGDNTNDGNTVELTGSILHQLNTLPNGGVISLRPRFNEEDYGIFFTHDYTIFLCEPDGTVLKEYAFSYTGRYFNRRGDPPPPIEFDLFPEFVDGSLALTMGHGGVCVFEDGRLWMGTGVRVPNPGSTWVAGWLTTIVDDSAYFTRLYVSRQPLGQPLEYQLLTEVPTSQRYYQWTESKLVAFGPDFQATYDMTIKAQIIKRVDGSVVSEQVFNNEQVMGFCNPYGVETNTVGNGGTF